MESRIRYVDNNYDGTYTITDPATGKKVKVGNWEEQLFELFPGIATGELSRSDAEAIMELFEEY